MTSSQLPVISFLPRSLALKIVCVWIVGTSAPLKQWWLSNRATWWYWYDCKTIVGTGIMLTRLFATSKYKFPLWLNCLANGLSSQLVIVCQWWLNCCWMLASTNGFVEDYVLSWCACVESTARWKWLGSDATALCKNLARKMKFLSKIQQCAVFRHWNGCQVAFDDLILY